MTLALLTGLGAVLALVYKLTPAPSGPTRKDL